MTRQETATEVLADIDKLIAENPEHSVSVGGLKTYRGHLIDFRDRLSRSLAAGRVVSREEVEQALEKSGAYRRKQTLWLVTTKEATEAVRALMKTRHAPPADPAKASV